MPYCLIALGSNLGDRACQLCAAVELLKGVPGVKVSAVSAWHATEPVGGPPGQPGYLNAALRAEVSRSPHELLREMQTIEGRLGRGPHGAGGLGPSISTCCSTVTWCCPLPRCSCHTPGWP